MIKMGRKQKEYSETEKTEIKERYKISKDAKEQKRLLCIKLRMEKRMATKEITEITGYTESHVRRLISKYGRKGITALTSKEQGGNHRNLSLEAEKTVLVPFEREARAGKVLIVKEIQKAYEKAVGHDVAVSTVYRVLERHKWRKIMPRGKHPKSKGEEMEAYKKTE
jgi:transposase